MGLIQSGALDWHYLASGAIVSGQLALASVSSGHIASGQVGSHHLASGTVLSGGISSGQVGENHLSSGVVVGQLRHGGGAIGNFPLTNQTASASGLIISVPETGLYRVASYAEITQGGLLNLGVLAADLSWTSDAQAQTLTVFTGLVLVTSGVFNQATTTLRALSGTSIIGSVSLSSLVGSPRYNAFFAAERLT